MAMVWSSAEDKARIEAEGPWPAKDLHQTVYARLTATKDAHGGRLAISFQLFSEPSAPAESLTWGELHTRVTQTANMLQRLGVGPGDTVAYLLPNCTETVLALLGGVTAGVVNPINPLLEPEQIASILRDTEAKVLITLKSFPKSDIAQKAAAAVAETPGVTHVVEVDLRRYLTGVKRLIVPFLRPKTPAVHHAKVLDFMAEITKQPKTLTFVEPSGDRIAAYFHTGGTTGMPKVAQHLQSGLIYNGWLGDRLLFDPEDVVICPLPLFHVFACHPILMSMVTSGAHVVFPTPAGYRGDGVMDNFWKLVERWQATFMIGVPTAFASLMQRPVNADLSCLRLAFSGSAPLPVELYRRFEEACNVNIVEGYGLTEATCLVSCNPIDGEKKIGSVGLPFPHTDVRILQHTEDGPIEMATGDTGEICIANPGVYAGSTYTEEDKNHDLFHDHIYLRTGDLGYLDEDGFLWITGRAKDLIIRGGHNIDPAVIEDCLAGHEAVALAGAIGQPDAFAGELPCAYVELVDGATVSEADLLAYCAQNISERAAVPKHLEVVADLPKTAVGKIFKPDLRKRAIHRVYSAALADADLAAEVAEIVEDKRLGLVAELRRSAATDCDGVGHILNAYTIPWRWADETQNSDAER